MIRLFIKNTIKFLLIIFIPLIILGIGYLYYDPFKVLRAYNDYSYAFVVPNRDFISTEMFMKNNDRYHYNSFVFGSSRTLAYRPSSWVKYLPADARPFMFDASLESVYGIYTKLKFLESQNVKINNALVILCRDVSFSNEANHNGHLYVKHPKTSGENNFDFQMQFFKAYCSPKFLYCFYAYTFSKQFKPYMQGFIENRKVVYDTVTNLQMIVDQEKEISENPDAYYAKRKTMFYERKGEKTDPEPRISKRLLFMLKEIKRILEKNNANYKVVLSPLYEQQKFNNGDISTLRSLFGNNLFDFSGKNDFTNYKTNYYETNHYRPNIGDSILKIIYK